MTVTLYTTGPTIGLWLGLNSLPDSSYAVWDSDVWDGGGAKFGPDAQYVDITQYIRSLSISMGRQRESDRYTGTMTVALDNRTARFTPGNTTGPYSVGGVTQLRPWVPIYLSWSYQGSQGTTFAGYVTTWGDQFPGGGKDAVTTITCVDLLAGLARYNGTAQSPVGAGETTGARIQRIINNTGQTPNTSIQAGQVTVQATTLAGEALTEIYLTADSEGGSVYSHAGAIVFSDQTYLLVSGTVVAWVFSNAGGTAIPFAEPVPIFDDTALRNTVRYSRVGGSQQTATDLTSRAQYGEIPYERNDLISQTDTQTATLAARDLQRWKQPEYRVASVNVYPRKINTSTGWLLVCSSQLKQRATVNVPVSVSGFQMTKNVFIDGYDHHITPSNWETTVYFASATWADVYAASLWDTAIWDTSVWN